MGGGGDFAGGFDGQGERVLVGHGVSFGAAGHDLVLAVYAACAGCHYSAHV
jgi:hypothetical protein